MIRVLRGVLKHDVKNISAKGVNECNWGYVWKRKDNSVYGETEYFKEEFSIKSLIIITYLFIDEITKYIQDEVL